MTSEDPNDLRRLVDDLGGDLGGAGEAKDGLRDLLLLAKEDLPSNARLLRVFAALPVGPVGGPDGDGTSGDGTSGDGTSGDGTSGDGDLGGGDAGGGLLGAGAVGATASKGVISKTVVGAGLSVLLATGAVGVWQLRGSTEVAPAQTSAAQTSAVPSKPQPLEGTGHATAKTTAETTESAAAPPSTGQPALRPAPTTSASAAPLARTEIEILREAQSALASNPQRTLTLLAEHENSYPSGSLGQEREMLRIVALDQSGQKAEAKARAQAILLRNPKSAYADRLRTMFPGL